MQLAKLCLSLLCEWSFTSVYTEQYVMKVEVYYRWILLCIWSFLSFFFLHYQCLECSRMSVCKLRQLPSQLAMPFQRDTTQSPKMFRFVVRASFVTSVDWLTVGVAVDGFSRFRQKGCQLTKSIPPSLTALLTLAKLIQLHCVVTGRKILIYPAYQDSLFGAALTGIVQQF